MNCTVCNVWLTTDSVSSLVCSLFFLYFSSFYLFFLFFTTCTHANIVDPANSHCCYDQNIALLVEHRVKITCYHVIFAMLLLVFFLLSYCFLLFFFSLLFYYIDFIFLRTFTTSGWHDKNNKGICAHKLWYCCKTWSKWLQTIQMELMHFYHERGKMCDINSQCGQLNALTFLTCESNGRENFYLLQFDFLFMRDKTKQDKRIWHFSWPIIRQLWGSVYNNKREKERESER